MMTNKTDKAYVQWMIRKVDADQYRHLCFFLAHMPFHSMIMMDSNRVEMAVYMRNEFFKTEHTFDIFDKSRCSVLEFLVSFADEITNLISIYDIHTIFMMFLGNMGLDICTNYWFENHENHAEYVMDRANIMMDRAYADDGRDGGLFIISLPRKDFVNREWWWQMQYWLDEQNIPDI